MEVDGVMSYLPGGDDLTLAAPAVLGLLLPDIWRPELTCADSAAAGL